MSDLRDSAEAGGRAIVWGIAALVVVIVLACAAAYGFGWFSDTTVDRRGQTDQQEQVRGDGTYRIARYDLFFDRCNAVVAVEGDIAATEQAIAGDDTTQRFYDQQNLRAQQANRRTLIASYNADAAKEATAGQFRDSQLPYRIDPNGQTTCTG